MTESEDKFNLTMQVLEELPSDSDDWAEDVLQEMDSQENASDD